MSWPLTGRAEELRFIDTALRRTDGPRGVVLAGDAGVGKTRLARETLAAAERRGSIARWTVATASARSLPLGAFLGVPNAGGADRARVVRQAMATLLDGAAEADVMVGVDDAHLLDELSAALVHQLVLHSAATVIVTVRSGEPAPDAITALWKDGHLSRLEVQPLSDQEMGTLLAAVLGGPVDSASMRRICGFARGSGLYLRELIDGALESGSLREIRGVWSWTGESVVSPSLRELIDSRLGRMSRPLSKIVDILALGEPLGIELLARMTDPATMEQAESTGLISVAREGQNLEARLAHPLYGEVRRAGLGQLRARRLRGQIAQLIAETGADRAQDILRRAVLTLDSDLDADPLLFAVAANRALELCDLVLAERLARAAAISGGGYEAHVLLAYALSLLNRGAEADIELSRLVPLAGTDDQRAQVALIQAANLFWTLARPDDAEAALDDAGATISETGARAVLTAARAAIHACRGRPSEATKAARAATSAGELPDIAFLLATWGLVLGLGLIGRADEVDAAAARAYTVASRSVASGIHRFPLGGLHIIVLQLAGYVPAAEQVALDLREDPHTPGAGQVVSAALLGRAALGRGAVQTAHRQLREALAGIPSIGAPGWKFLCLPTLVEALALAGDLPGARQALHELEENPYPAFAFLEPENVLARARVVAAEGAVREAISLARAAAASANGSGQIAHEVLALHAVVRLGDPTAGPRLAELATLVDGPRAPAAAAHAVALAANDGAALIDVSREFERMGDLLAAIDAAAHAAIVEARSGRRSAAHAATMRATELAEICEGARTPALVAAVRPLPLSTREREVLALAALGLTNRQIAERLVVSVRTVEGHVYRAGTRLGTTSRAESAALLRTD